MLRQGLGIISSLARAVPVPPIINPRLLSPIHGKTHFTPRLVVGITLHRPGYGQSVWRYLGGLLFGYDS